MRQSRESSTYTEIGDVLAEIAAVARLAVCADLGGVGWPEDVRGDRR